MVVVNSQTGCKQPPVLTIKPITFGEKSQAFYKLSKRNKWLHLFTSSWHGCCSIAYAPLGDDTLKKANSVKQLKITKRDFCVLAI